MNDNKTFQWLKRHGSHVNTKQLAQDLDKNYDMEWLKSNQIHSALTWLADQCVDSVLSDRKSAPRSTVIKHALEVNATQFSRFTKYEDKLKFMALDRKCWVVEDYKSISTDLVPIDVSTKLQSYIVNMLSVDKPISTFKTRKLVLYYRGAREETEYKQFGCDLFQFALIHQFIKKLIESRTLTLFNDISIVSRTNWVPGMLYKMIPDVELLSGSNEKFLANTCLCANTIHFFGGELPESWLFNTPITGSLYDIIDYGKKTPNRVSLPFLNYSGVIDSTGQYIIDKEDEHVIDDKWVSWDDILKPGSKYNINNENVTLGDIITNLCLAIDTTERMLLDDDINFDHVK